LVVEGEVHHLQELEILVDLVVVVLDHLLLVDPVRLDKDLMEHLAHLQHLHVVAVVEVLEV
jgi:hypothetical protein